MKKQKKLISLVLAVLMVVTMLPLSAISASAATSGKCGANINWSLNNGILTLTGSGSMYDYKYYGDSNHAPWQSQSSPNYDIKQIVVGNGITRIGNHAFSNCSLLTSVSLPNTVTEIGQSAFDSDYKLTSIVLPTNLTKIDYSAFMSSGLTSINIPNKVTTIGDSAFFACRELASAVVPDSVTSLGNSAFYACEALKSVTLPSNLTAIPNSLFNGCKSLKSIDIPSGVTSIGYNSFNDCRVMESIELPSGVTKIGSSAFAYCVALKDINIPSGVTSIGYSAFQSCIALENIELPSGITTINYSFFKNCSSLESITIPSNITYIDHDAFSGCTALSTVTFERPDTAHNLTLKANVFDENQSLAYTGSGNLGLLDGETVLEEGATLSDYNSKTLAWDVTTIEGEAAIGRVGYPTLEEAIAAAQSGDTVVLLQNVTLEDTLSIASGKNIKLDLAGYDISGEVNGKLIENNGTLEFVGGTGHIYNTDITAQGHDAFMNYGTATVNAPVHFGDADDDMTNANAINRGAGFRNYGTATINNGYYTAIDNNKISGAYAYAVINDENGTLTVNGATVYGKNNGNLACNTGTTTINGGTYTLNNSTKKTYYNIYTEEGTVNVTDGTFVSNNTTAALCVASTSVNGEINIEGGDFTYNTIKKTSASDEKVNISGGSFSAEVPQKYCANGFIPVTEPNPQGKYTVERAREDGYNLTVEDCIHMNLYVTVDDYVDPASAVLTVTYNEADKQTPTPTTVEYSGDDLAVLKDTEDGRYVVKVLSAPAQIRDDVTVTVNDGTRDVHTFTTNVAKYCEAVIATSNDAKLVALAKTMLDYGKAASTEFSYNVGGFEEQSYYNTAEATELNAKAVINATNANGQFASYSYVAKSVPAFRIYVTPTEFECARGKMKATVTNQKTGETKTIAPLVVEGTDKVCIDLTGILAEDLDDVLEIEFNGGTITINALQYAKARGASSNFGRSLYNYYAAAESYFV